MAFRCLLKYTQIASLDQAVDLAQTLRGRTKEWKVLNDENIC